MLRRNGIRLGHVTEGSCRGASVGADAGDSRRGNPCVDPSRAVKIFAADADFRESRNKVAAHVSGANGDIGEDAAWR